MKQLLFSIFDCKAKTWTAPFAGLSEEDAKIAFAQACMDVDHPIGCHAGDYTLYRIGSWDSETAAMQEVEPVNLGNGIYYAREQEPPRIARRSRSQAETEQSLADRLKGAFR